MELTFECLGLDEFRWFGWLTGTVHVGGQHSELVLFALGQVKHGIARRSDGHLCVHALPCSGADLALCGGGKRRGLH